MITIGYVKTFKVEDKINKLMSFRIDDEKLLEKYKAICTKIKDLKNIELDALPVYDDRYITNKIITYGDKVYTNICGLNVPEDDIEFESFTVISIDSLLVYDEKYYLQLFLDNCSYKIVNKQTTDYLDENLFENYYHRINISEGIDLAKSNKSRECMICHYWPFNHGFKFQNSVCNGCHDLSMLCLNISDIAIITVKNVDYCCIMYSISKSEAINLLENSVLEDRGYI